MKCPRDRSILVFVEEGGQVSNRCPQCSGLLLEEEDVAAAMGKRGVPAAEKLASLPESKVTCPRDGKPMRLLMHEGVEIDLCAECNALWLDAGEIEKIKRSRGGAGRKAALAAGVAGAAAVAAGGAALAATPPGSGASALSGIGDVVIEGGIEIAFEFLGEILGSLF